MEWRITNTREGELWDTSCPVHIAECFHSSASEFARGLEDFHFQLFNSVSAPVCKHTTTPESKQGSSHPIDTRVTEPGKSVLEGDGSPRAHRQGAVPVLQGHSPWAPGIIRRVASAQTFPLSSFSIYPANYSALLKHSILTSLPNAFHFYHPSHLLKLPSFLSTCLTVLRFSLSSLVLSCFYCPKWFNYLSTKRGKRSSSKE